jgi:SAM-dependent methyltransferase
MGYYPLDRLNDVWVRHGLWGTVRLLPHNLGRAIRSVSPARLRARKREIAFDRAHGIDTATPAALSTLGIEPARTRHAVEYRASGIDFIYRRIAELDIDHARYTFVDLGSGKGRALLIASHFPFRQIIGVEFSEKLNAIARANIAAYHPGDQRCRRIEAICGDAGTFEPPDGPLVIYLYNAFDAVILRRVAARLGASLAVAPRDVILLYVNPVHRSVLDPLPWLRLARDENGTATYRAHDAPV